MKAIKIHEPKVCPFCGSPIVRQLEDGAHLYCSNPNCPERKIAKLNYFVTKECMNIDGLSEKTIRKMCNTLEINNWCDLYNYTLEDFLSAGLGEKTALKIATELNNSKQKASAVKILVSLGIPMIGKVNATKLLEEFGSIQELENAATNTQYNPKNIMSHKLGYAIIDLIGDVAGQTFVDYVNNNRDEFKKVYEIFDNTSLEKKESVSNEGSALAGLIILATGTLKNFSRDGIKDSVVANGGTYASGISKKLDYLIVGEGAGPSKLKKAEELGLKQITEEQYLEMIK